MNSNGIGYVKKEKGDVSQLVSIFSKEGKKTAIPADMFESYGTIRFINLFPLILQALRSGATLVIDEMDASIHPMAIADPITIFHNDEINIHHAQLIFNTHNPLFLNGNLFRRDEIKFVDRNETTKCSTHYSLSDFGTSGQNGVRKTSDYMKNYFVDRYGAIRNIEMEDIVKGVLGIHKKGGEDA